MPELKQVLSHLMRTEKPFNLSSLKQKIQASQNLCLEESVFGFTKLLDLIADDYFGDVLKVIKLEANNGYRLDPVCSIGVAECKCSPCAAVHAHAGTTEQSSLNQYLLYKPARNWRPYLNFQKTHPTFRGVF